MDFVLHWLPCLSNLNSKVKVHISIIYHDLYDLKIDDDMARVC